MKYTQRELKEMAQTIMINPSSNKSKELLNTLSYNTGLPAQMCLMLIQQLANN